MTRESWAFVIALAMALGVIGLIKLWPLAVEAKVEGDLIRAAGLAIPIFGSFLLWLIKTNRDREMPAEERARRLRNLLVALRAEIEMQLDQYLEQLGPDDLEAKRAYFNLRLDEATPDELSMPAGVVPSENFVFDNMKQELPELPDPVIRWVISYYQADEYVVELVRSFGAGAFEKRPIESRRAALEGYFSQMLIAALAAFPALEAIDQFLNGKPTQWSDKKQKAREFMRAQLEASPGDSTPVQGG